MSRPGWAKAVHLMACVVASILIIDAAPASADNCSGLSDCFLNIPFLLALGLVIGLILFGLSAWLWGTGALGIGFIIGWSGSVLFGTPLTNSDPNDPNVRAIQDLINNGAAGRPPGSPGPDIQDILNHVNPSRGTNNCGSVAEAIDDILAGQAATASNYGGVNDMMLEGREGRLFNEVPVAGAENSIESQLTTEGSRGIIRVQDAQGNAHVFNVVNIGGTVYYLDGQTATTNTSLTDMLNSLGYTNPVDIQFMRTAP